VDIFLADLRAGAPILEETKLDFQAIADRVDRDPIRFERELERLIQEHFQKDNVILQTKEEFPEFAAAAEALFPTYAKEWAKRISAETAQIAWEGITIRTRKFALHREGVNGSFVDIANWPEFNQVADKLDFQALADECGRDPQKFQAALLALAQKRWDESAVIKKALKDFPGFSAEASRLVSVYASEWFKRIESETIRSLSNGYLIYMRRFALRRFRPGDRVYSLVSQQPGLILKTAGRLALMHDGRVVPTDSNMHQLNSVVIDSSGREPAPFGRAPGWRATLILCIGYVYILLSAVKDRILGKRKSLLLWQLSVAYRAVLRRLGVEARPLFTGQKPR